MVLRFCLGEFGAEFVSSLFFLHLILFYYRHFGHQLIERGVASFSIHSHVIFYLYDAVSIIILAIYYLLLSLDSAIFESIDLRN
jgi:hypothetical protein